MSEQTPKTMRTRTAVVWIGVAAIAALAAGFVLTGLLVNIFERKQEARNPFYRVVDITDNEEDPAVWGKNFPLQYDGYLRTVDQTRTRYGGSEALPRPTTAADPRAVVSQSKIEADPRLKKMWAGYAFSIDFREERGHAYMLDDQTFTGRQAKPQPGACINCHASSYLTMKKLGNGDLQAGFTALNKMKYMDARELVTHPVACIDCHDPATMALRITRPAFMSGIARAKAAEGVQNYDVNTMATRQEMRSYVCAQCHVEYYFKGEGKELYFPWDKGLKADQILAYYDQVGQKDWVHQDTGAPVLKVQHPEFETWSQGTHAQNGVACADCHMPYTRVGALKISDHHVQSPLLNINNACQNCHQVPEAELKARVEKIQDTHFELRNHAMDALMDLIDGLVAAKAAGATDDQLKEARDYQRAAQFYLDFAEAENSTGFHAPQEGARILGLSLDNSRKGWMSLPPGGQQAKAVPPRLEGGLPVYPTAAPTATGPAPTATPTTAQPTATAAAP
jgi:nitrite reductase (cytochrome c-552)